MLLLLVNLDMRSRTLYVNPNVGFYRITFMYRGRRSSTLSSGAMTMMTFLQLRIKDIVSVEGMERAFWLPSSLVIGYA